MREDLTLDKEVDLVEWALKIYQSQTTTKLQQSIKKLCGW